MTTSLPRRFLLGCVPALAALLTACGGGGSATPTATVAATSGGTAQALSVHPSTLRQTSIGWVNGVDHSDTTGTLAWLGIPYAQPPVGDLRWRPTVPPSPWTGVRSAQQLGASCIQGGRYFSPAPNNAPYGLSVRDGFGKPVGSEDCLTLNVWRPSTTQTKLPVVVFIHGGSNISGYSGDPIYEGQVLAQKAQAVVITINYRLGMFGWFNLAQLKTGDPIADSGNFGTLDQIQALKFVQANAEAFGGDAGNVTVMGQSAGAVNVWALLVSPLTAGLMHKAVPLSGGIAFSNGVSTAAYANGLLAATMVADGTAPNATLAGLVAATKGATQTAAYLRGKSAEDLIRVELANASVIGTAPAVIPDGAVVPLVPAAAIAAGNYRQIPLLAGNTVEEGKLFGAIVGAYVPNDYDRFTMQFNFDPNAAPTLTEGDLLNAAYLPVDKPLLGWNAVASVLTTSVFGVGTLESMTPLALKQPGMVWYYEFGWNQEPVPFNTVYGSAHAMDLPFMFGNFGPSAFSFGFSTANQPGRLALSDAMIGSLSAFMRTGNPNNPGLGMYWPNWPARLNFDATPTALRLSTS